MLTSRHYNEHCFEFISVTYNCGTNTLQKFGFESFSLYETFIILIVCVVSSG